MAEREPATDQLHLAELGVLLGAREQTQEPGMKWLAGRHPVALGWALFPLPYKDFLSFFCAASQTTGGKFGDYIRITITLLDPPVSDDVFVPGGQQPGISQ